MKIKTELLQKMISKAIHGASANKMIPLSSLIGIEVKRKAIDENSELILTTTDGSNQLKISTRIESEKNENSNFRPDNQFINFHTIVNADTFAKLVGKTTKEFIELENKENYLEVKGNGTYKLEIAINEEGEMVRFPAIKELDVEPYSIDTKLLQESIKTAKASVAKTMEVPCLTGYYIADKIITTDRQLVFQSNIGLSKEPLLISSEMAELLLLVDEETINVLHKDTDLIFFNRDFKIAGKELEGKEMYPVEPIENLIKLDYNSSIEVNKQELLNVLDRMSLFITDYDKNGVFLTISRNGLAIQSQKSNAVEIVDIVSDKEPVDFNCLIDIEMLKSQIETVSTDMVEIFYGQDKSIKIVDGNCIHIISLLEKSN